MIAECLKKVVSGENLSEEESYQSMQDMIDNHASPVKVGALLTSMAMKGETVDEITGFAKAMREVAVKVNCTKRPLVDTCGTGGDTLKTFNISTAAALIAASCGVTMAKHGNRSITSKCGGADILEAVGVNINCNAAEVEYCMENAGIGFMFAPLFHPATKKFGPVRKDLGIRTIFNILGPLTSPASADIQLLGVFDPDYVEPMAQVLKNLNVQRAMVMHGFDSNNHPAMDEISTLGKTKVALLDKNKVEVREYYPEDFGIKRTVKEHVMAAETLEENLDIFLGVLKGRQDSLKEEARLDLCLVNAAAILFISGKVSGFDEGMESALESVQEGYAMDKLDEFINISNMKIN